MMQSATATMQSATATMQRATATATATAAAAAAAATQPKARRARRARSESDRKKHAGWRRCPRCNRSVSTNGRNFYHHMHKCDRVFFAERIAELDMLRSARKSPRVTLSQLQRALFVQQLSFLRVYDRTVDSVCVHLERSDPNLFRTALFQAVRDAKSRRLPPQLPHPPPPPPSSFPPSTTTTTTNNTTNNNTNNNNNTNTNNNNNNNNNNTNTKNNNNNNTNNTTTTTTTNNNNNNNSNNNTLLPPPRILFHPTSTSSRPIPSNPSTPATTPVTPAHPNTRPLWPADDNNPAAALHTLLPPPPHQWNNPPDFHPHSHYPNPPALPYQPPIPVRPLLCNPASRPAQTDPIFLAAPTSIPAPVHLVKPLTKKRSSHSVSKVTSAMAISSVINT